jgi:two-component system, chemotaxis family, protein-glutamate methylesterase/glutaminase
MLAAIVGRHATTPVAYAEEGELPRHGCIDIAPPGHHLVICPSGALGFDDGPKVEHSRPSVNRLFETAAEVFGPRVIGVVLSGGDGDGTDGLSAIKARGGVSIVQSPADAVAPSMPTNALLHDSPDYAVLIEELGPLLMSLVKERASSGGAGA